MKISAVRLREMNIDEGRAARRQRRMGNVSRMRPSTKASIYVSKDSNVRYSIQNLIIQ